MENSINDFWVIGINYRKSDTNLRGRYAISKEQYVSILKAAPAFGIKELFLLSTCNRTEIYGFTQDPLLLLTLLCNFTQGNQSDFSKNAYQKYGKDALSHIFHVAGGLDSQILGDYEIVGQLKQSIFIAKEHDCIYTFTDRLFKTVLQSCRAIRSKTGLSTGTVSVAFAAVQYLKNTVVDLSKKKILLVGLGEIGRNTCKNLVGIVPPGQITLMNRNAEKAEVLASEYGLNTTGFDHLYGELKTADIVIVATNADEPIINKNHFQESEHKILIDLSIPNNIDQDVKTLPNISLANVDDLSKINDETFRRRKAEVPKAKAFITFYIHQFAEWYLMRKHVPVLKSVKEKLGELNKQLSLAEETQDVVAMQKIINNMALKIRSENPRTGCNYIEALNGYLKDVAH